MSNYLSKIGTMLVSIVILWSLVVLGIASFWSIQGINYPYCILTDFDRLGLPMLFIGAIGVLLARCGL